MEELSIPTVRPSGRVLPGTLLQPSSPGALSSSAVLMLHGMLCSRDHNFAPALAAALTSQLGCCTYRLDFRSVAPDPAEPEHSYSFCGFSDDLSDACAALSMLQARGLQLAAVLGHSRGATVALLLASQQRLTVPVVAIAPRFHLQHMLTGLFSKPKQQAALASGSPFQWSTRLGPVTVTPAQVAALSAMGDMAQTVQSIPAEANILLVHGSADATIPVADAQAYAQARGPGLQLAILDQANHNFTSPPGSAEELIACVGAFLAAQLAQPASASGSAAS
jgi:pimeloyl-ACP methyl ester carboxylesterase